MYLDIPFPACLSYGAIGTPTWSTAVATNQGGWEQRNQIWSYALQKYDVSTAIRTRSDYQEVLAHFNQVRGRLNSFPFRDPLDFDIAPSEGVLVYVSPGVFQLHKQYGDTNPYLRKITRPVDVIVRRAGTPVGTLDPATGLFTIAPDQSKGINSHAVGATHQFTLASAFSPNVIVGSIVYAAGITGTAAALLNALPLTVTAVAAGVVSVNVNTTGLTASGGTLTRRVASSELTASGEFRVPVRYGSDELPGQVVSGNGQEVYIQATSVLFAEVRE